MNNVANNPIHNRGVAAAHQTTNTASTNSRSGGRGLCNAVASLCSALHKQVTTRSPADARMQNQPIQPVTLKDAGSLLVRPFKGIATGFQMAKRDNEMRRQVGNPVEQTNTAKRTDSSPTGQTNSAKRSSAASGTPNLPFNEGWQGLVGAVGSTDFITPFLAFNLFDLFNN